MLRQTVVTGPLSMFGRIRGNKLQIAGDTDYFRIYFRASLSFLMKGFSPARVRDML